KANRSLITVQVVHLVYYLIDYLKEKIINITPNRAESLNKYEDYCELISRLLGDLSQSKNI
ncbi:hypothetical protein BpHYR1_040111, partial [Brachionus plicatilis]